MQVQPQFLEGVNGKLFSLLRSTSTARHCVVFVPPFAEEMNKCRRQVTLTASLLARENIASLVFDLYGTGDSEGEFSHATWVGWIEDTRVAFNRVVDLGFEVIAIISARLGCALAAQSLKDQSTAVSSTVFWQPVESGRQNMSQFLRLRSASSMIHNRSGETVEELRQRLYSGETLEISGYELSGELCRSIDDTTLSTDICTNLGALRVFEVGRFIPDEPSRTAQRLISAAHRQGADASADRIVGDPYWNATEIVEIAELCQETSAFIASATSS